MRRKNIKDRCEKRKLPKFSEVCKTYDAVQYAFATMLSENEDVKEILCNVYLEGLEEGEYTSDFVCTKNNEELMVRECVFRKHLSKPMTVKLLDASREYWIKRGVIDWGIVVEKEGA